MLNVNVPLSLLLFRVIWKSLLVLYSKDVLSDLVTVHMHGGQPRWQYCTQVRQGATRKDVIENEVGCETNKYQ